MPVTDAVATALTELGARRVLNMQTCPSGPWPNSNQRAILAASPHVGVRVPLHSQVRADVHGSFPEEPRAAGHPADQTSVPAPALSYRHEVGRRPDRGMSGCSRRSPLNSCSPAPTAR